MSKFAGLFALGVIILASGASAQSAAPRPAAGPRSDSGAAVPPPPGAAAVRPALPDVTKMTLLVQTHMAALGAALATDNFSVLHALGSPSFRELNPPERLAQTFAKFKAAGIDIQPVVLYQPILVNQPALNEKGLLRLTGYYKTEPQQVHFDFLFQSVAGSWKLYGISASTQPVNQVAATSPEPAQAKDAKAAAPPAAVKKSAK